MSVTISGKICHFLIAVLATRRTCNITSDLISAGMIAWTCRDEYENEEYMAMESTVLAR